MLQPGRGRAAEHEDRHRDERAFRTPAAPREQPQHRQRAGQEMGEDHEVEQLHGRSGHQPAEQQHRRREQQCLGIGDRRMAAEMVRVPERQLAIRERFAEVTEHGVEVVLRIPRNDAAGQGPGECRAGPEAEDGADRQDPLPARPHATGSPQRLDVEREILSDRERESTPAHRANEFSAHRRTRRSTVTSGTSASSSPGRLCSRDLSGPS